MVMLRARRESCPLYARRESHVRYAGGIGAVHDVLEFIMIGSVDRV